jgi:hypothetical protein
MTSLQQAFTKTQAQWRELEEISLPNFFVAPVTWEVVSADYDETDSDRAGEGGND